MSLSTVSNVVENNRALYRKVNADAWQQSVIELLKGSDFWKYSARMSDCGSPRGLYCACCGHKKVVKYWCMSRFCLSCARRFNGMMYQKIKARYEWLKSRQEVAGYGLKLITLTIKTDGDVKGAMEKLKFLPKLWNKILKKKSDGKVRSGLVTAYEFGKQSLNLHIHGLYYGPYISQKLVSDTWYHLTGSYVVDIRKADDYAIYEIIKYTADLTKLSPEQILTLVGVMDGKRRIRTYGVFYSEDNKELELKLKILYQEIVACPVCDCKDWITDNQLEFMYRRARSP